MYNHDSLSAAEIARSALRQKFYILYLFRITFSALPITSFKCLNYFFLSYTGTNQIVDSAILKWNTKSRKFESFQPITTIGAYDWTFFSVKGYQFLAVAQAFNGLTTLMESVIYVFQEGKFVPFQTLEVL